MTTLNSQGRIVVGTDGSPQALRAVEWAADRAKVRNKPLLIVTGAPEVVLPKRTAAAALIVSGSQLAEDYKKKLEARLEQAVTHTRETHPDITIESACVQGDIGQILAQASKDAELVVVGARGVSAPPRVRLLGGHSDDIATHSTGPVAIVPEEAENYDGPVVVGIDDSREARYAAWYAFKHASVLGHDLVVVTAWDYGPYDAYGEVWLHNQEEMIETLEAEVETIIGDFRKEFPDVRVTVKAVRGRPARSIIEQSKEASVVIVGSRGRGGFAGLLLGSTSKHVLRESYCPVIVLRAPKDWK